MRGLLLDLLPQMFNRVEIGGVGRQLLDRQASRMRLEKRLYDLACMIPRPILNHDDMTSSLRQPVEQKGRIALGIKAPLMRFVEKPPRAIVDEAKDLVAFTFAAGAHFGLLPIVSGTILAEGVSGEGDIR